jgi:hypothetical protein
MNDPHKVGAACAWNSEDSVRLPANARRAGNGEFSESIPAAAKTSLNLSMNLVANSSWRRGPPANGADTGSCDMRQALGAPLSLNPPLSRELLYLWRHWLS